MAVVIDNFLDEAACADLLKSFPPLEGGMTRKLPTLDVPLELERRMRGVLRDPLKSSTEAQAFEAAPIRAEEPLVPLVARLASGSVPMHQDCFNPFDAAETGFIDSYVAVLYLAGAGSFVLDGGDGERAIDIVPRRLIAWPNGACHHRLDAAPGGGVRAMLGPVAVDADGLMQRAHDVWSTHPGYIGYLAHKEAQERGLPWPPRAEAAEQGRPKLCLSLSLADSPKGSLLNVVSMSGETLTTLPIGDPDAVPYGAVLKKLCKKVNKATSGRASQAAFLLPDATLLGEAHHGLSIRELFTPVST